MNLDDPQTLATTLAAILSGVTAAGGAFATWAIKRWISKTDQKLEYLADVVFDLKTKSAISQERYDSSMGAMSMLRESIQDSNQATGILKASVDKIWTILQIKGVITPQASDQIVNKGQ